MISEMDEGQRQFVIEMLRGIIPLNTNDEGTTNDQDNSGNEPGDRE